jgi:hypothetical protein
MSGEDKGGIGALIMDYSTVGAASSRDTRSVVYEKTRKGERLFFILLFLDEKKQKSSDCT